VLFLTDIFPTGYMAAENCNIQLGDIIAVWGCGPVGQMAIASALMLGADKVVAIDCVPARLRMAARLGAVETINFEEDDVFDRLKQLTAGRGPDACIEAVGLEAHGATLDAYVDRAKAAVFLATDRPTALRQAIHACRKGGTVSIPGVYGGFLDKMPFGAAFGKGLTFKMGQTHVMKYLRPLLDRIDRVEIDPSFVITHRLPIDQAAEAYRTFRDNKDECIKVVLKPH
jgi:threonine dehydrogenase-like Zn-dependent dehydrogenase